MSVSIREAKRAPLLWVAAFFAAGVVFQWVFSVPAFLLAAAAAALGAAAWRLRKLPGAANPALLVLISLLGACRAEGDARQVPDSVARWVCSSPTPAAIKGTLVSDPIWTRDYRSWYGWLEVEAVKNGQEWAQTRGRIFVRCSWAAGRWAYGDRLELYGNLRAGNAVSASNQRRFDEARWLWVHGAECILSVSGEEGIQRIGRSHAPWTILRRGIARFRERLVGLGRSLMGPAEAGLLEAMVLGQQQELPLAIREDFRKTGTIHVLVVSGSNVGLIGLVALAVLSFLRLPREMRYLMLAGILLVYCILTGWSPPILRATLMGILLCWAAIGGLEVSPLNLAAAAACLILAVDPRALADVSFQLSFSAVFGILAVVRMLPAQKKTQRPWRRWAGFLRDALTVSTAAWAATAPFLLWHFQQVSGIAPLANLAVVPWASVLMAAGLLVYAAAFFSPMLAAPFASGFSWLAQGLTRLVSWFAAL